MLAARPDSPRPKGHPADLPALGGDASGQLESTAVRISLGQLLELLPVAMKRVLRRDLDAAVWVFILTAPVTELGAARMTSSQNAARCWSGSSNGSTACDLDTMHT
jgi:hypothetical protein